MPFEQWVCAFEAEQAVHKGAQACSHLMPQGQLLNPTAQRLAKGLCFRTILPLLFWLFTRV